MVELVSYSEVAAYASKSEHSQQVALFMWLSRCALDYRFAEKLRSAGENASDTDVRAPAGYRGEDAQGRPLTGYFAGGWAEGPARGMAPGVGRPVDWRCFDAVHVGDFDLLHAIPNGGARDKITAGRLKAEGVKAGVPDLFWPVVIFDEDTETERHGLYIEMKRPETRKASTKRQGKTVVDSAAGRVQKTQTDWHTRLEKNGYHVVTCYTYIEALNAMWLYCYAGFPVAITVC